MGERRAPVTRLEEYVTSFVAMPTRDVLSHLQLAGVVSDLCMKLGDVAEADQQKAIAWIARNLE